MLNVLNNPPAKLPPMSLASLIRPKPAKPVLTKQQRLARPPEKPSKKFPLSKKEIQVLHVAVIHINMWLLDSKNDYPEIEELYMSLKTVAWSFYKHWDKEVAYAQSNLNKLASKLPAQTMDFTIPVGSFYTDMVDEEDNIESITEPSLKLIHIAKPKQGEKVWSLQRKNFINSDTKFTAKVKWVMPTMNPLTFGLALAMFLAESKNIDLKLRQKWMRNAVSIYNDVEKELGINDYSLKNSNILASLYCNNMYQEYTSKGVFKTHN